MSETRQVMWSWVLMLLSEGIASVAVGVACFFCLPDSPVTARWLRPEEARFLELNHVSTRGARVAHEDGKKKGTRWTVIWQVLTDGQLYLQAIVFASNSVPNYGLKVSGAP